MTEFGVQLAAQMQQSVVTNCDSTKIAIVESENNRVWIVGAQKKLKIIASRSQSKRYIFL